MTKNTTILVIDDEPQIRKLLEITLESDNYKTLFASTGKEGIVLAASHKPDLILLDLGLADLDGQEVLVKLREWYSDPIIILTVKNTESEIVRALDNGANDFLTKPFRSQELLARIRSALRNRNIAQTDLVYVFQNITIDLTAHTVKVKDEFIKLTATEFQLLAMLVQNEGRVLTHQYLLKEVWGASHIEQTQYLRVFIAQLRKKIEVDANSPQYILTESGIGYRFNAS